jgi:Ca2+-binding EF-hand superfamily protein
LCVVQLFDASGTGKIPKDEMAVILRDLAGMSGEDAAEALAVATAGQEDSEEFVDASAFLDLLFSI